MSGSQDVTPESSASCQTLDETSKQGVCWTELKRTGMAQWGARRRFRVVGQDKKHNILLSAPVKKECEKYDEVVIGGSVVKIGTEKRNRQFPSHLQETSAAKRVKKEESERCQKQETKNGASIDRWSSERYKTAEKYMLDIMKAEGAYNDTPIPRPALRMATRKCVGDTGLLDHLLSHCDGKLAPGGLERFRRCYNTSGSMEYWLEREETGNILDSNRKLACYRPAGGPSCDPVSDCHLELLQAEMAKMKKDIQDLTSKNKKQEDQANSVEEMKRELIQFQTNTNKHMMEISSALSGMQDMYRDLTVWKNRTEQQLTEISNSLSSLHQSKQHGPTSPVSERWEDWLDSSNLCDITGEEFVSWLENTDLNNVTSQTENQKSYLKPDDMLAQGCYLHNVEPELLEEQLAIKRDGVEDMGNQSLGDDNANVTPDSCITANSTRDVNTSYLLFQVMLKELVKWKSIMEERVTEISNSVAVMQASKQWSCHSQFYQR